VKRQQGDGAHSLSTIHFTPRQDISVLAKLLRTRLQRQGCNIYKCLNFEALQNMTATVVSYKYGYELIARSLMGYLAIHVRRESYLG